MRLKFLCYYSAACPRSSGKGREVIWAAGLAVIEFILTLCSAADVEAAALARLDYTRVVLKLSDAAKFSSLRLATSIDLWLISSIVHRYTAQRSAAWCTPIKQVRSGFADPI